MLPSLAVYELQVKSAFVKPYMTTDIGGDHFCKKKTNSVPILAPTTTRLLQRPYYCLNIAGRPTTASLGHIMAKLLSFHDFCQWWSGDFCFCKLNEL